MKLLIILSFRLPSGHITHVVVSNNIATFCCFGNSIYRYNLNSESAAESELLSLTSQWSDYFSSN